MKSRPVQNRLITRGSVANEQNPRLKYHSSKKIYRERVSEPEGFKQRDLSNGWEAVAPVVIPDISKSTVGVDTIRAWTKVFAPGAAILDLGCGPGTPRSQVLIDAGFAVHAVDASPTMASAYQRSFPEACVLCEAVEESSYFGERFDGVLSWGLMFLLPAETQRRVIHRVGGVVRTGGRFLFTAPFQVCTWADLSTDRLSVSLGRDAYISTLADAGFKLIAEYTDEGENHYYDAVRL
jgi:SAM-dependent methyltransferase